MKQGLDYVMLDVALDEKFDLIEAEFGLAGFAVVVKLYQRIYGGEGYYCEWNKEVALLFASRVHAGINAVSEIVSAAIRRGIFDREMYDKHGILTSVGIQKRCFKAVSRRKSFEIDLRYLLVDYTRFLKDVNIIIKNVDIPLENADISQQSTGEYSTGKESTGECIAHVPTLDDVCSFAKGRDTTVDPVRFWGYYDARKWILPDGTDISGRWQSMFLVWEAKDKREGKISLGTSGDKTFEIDEFFRAALANSYEKKEG